MGILATLPGRLRESVEKELAPDERVVWMEMPCARFFTPKATGTFLFGIPWTAFSVFWMYSVWSVDRPEVQAVTSWGSLIGLPFVLIGVFMLLAPVLSYRIARRSVYVITDKRALSFEDEWGMTVRSFTPDKLKDTFRRERRSGYGDVIISFMEWEDSHGDRRKEDIGFTDIRDPKYVEDLLRDLASRARHPSFRC